MDGCDYTFDPPRMPNFWDFSDVELALACRAIVLGHVAGPYADLHAEAGRLLALWHEALETPDRMGDERARRHSLSSGLRKRTIQVLVLLSMHGQLPTLEC